jgi:hypothetical protein
VHSSMVSVFELNRTSNKMNVSFEAPIYDPHIVPRYDVTSAQLMLLIVWVTAVLVWMTRYVRHQSASIHPQANSFLTGARSDVSVPSKYSRNNGGMVLRVSDKCGTITRKATEDCGSRKLLFVGHIVDNSVSKAMMSHVRPANGVTGGATLSSTRVPSVTPACLPTIDDCLLQIIWLGWLMIYFYMCDYRKVWESIVQLHAIHY